MRDEPKYFGLDELDRRIAAHVTEKGGTFVELGAFDGLRQNNTLYFERLGWRGVLIEPNPDAAILCRKNRPLAKVFECACVAADDERMEIPLTICGLMSIVKGARGGGESEDAWISRGEEVQSIQRREVTVKARTLQSVLDEAGVEKVDLLVLDVEGYEISVLEGIDFDRSAPHWIVGEDDYDDTLKDYLAGYGYECEAILLERRFTRDLLYKRKLRHTG
jgi:FkbM family methyltransferase